MNEILNYFKLKCRRRKVENRPPMEVIDHCSQAVMQQFAMTAPRGHQRWGRPRELTDNNRALVPRRPGHLNPNQQHMLIILNRLEDKPHSVCPLLPQLLSSGCVYSFNENKDGQTHRNSSANTNCAMITEYKLSEAKSLTTMDPGGRRARVFCGG